MRQNVENTERLDATFVALTVPVVLLVRVLHLHHLQTFQRFEIVVRCTGRRCTVTTASAVHLLFLLLVVLFVLPQRGNGITAAALVSSNTSTIRRPVITASRVAVLVVDHRLPRVTPSRAQSVRVILPRLRQSFVLFRGRGDHHQRQRTRTTD